jgi:hypothetical protein
MCGSIGLPAHFFLSGKGKQRQEDNSDVRGQSQLMPEHQRSSRSDGRPLPIAYSAV